MALNNTYDIVKAFEAIENELIASMIRNMKKHKLDEIDENKQWSMWQVEQLKSLEQYRRKNREKFGDDFKAINEKIEFLIRHAKDEGEMDQEIAILKAIKNGFKTKKAPKGATAEFFQLNEEKLEALIKATINDMEKVETAILRRADDQYRKIIYNAQVYANTGAGTYEQAVDMATKDMLSAGLNCVEYANGARHTLRDYADMAIRTATKRAYLQGEGTKRQEWGIPTVIVNKRQKPCPKCLPFCGKVLIDDVWSDGSKAGISPVTGLKYPLMSEAVAAGLYHPRCKDVHTTYFEGINTPPDGKYTRDELDEIAENYRREQKQQYAKRQAEKFGRLAKYSLDEDNQKKYKAKEREWLKHEQIFSEQASLISRKENAGPWRVDGEYINTKAYHDKFDKLDAPSTVREGVYKETVRLLDMVDGIEDEHMIAINSRTGKTLTDNLQRKGNATRTSFTAEEYTKIEACSEKIILIHNHSHNVRPSGTDIVTVAKNDKISMSIIACYDGDVYIIKSVKKEVAGIYEKYYNDLRSIYDINAAKALATNKLYVENEKHHWFDVERL